MGYSINLTDNLVHISVVDIPRRLIQQQKVGSNFDEYLPQPEFIMKKQLLTLFFLGCFQLAWAQTDIHQHRLDTLVFEDSTAKYVYRTEIKWVTASKRLIPSAQEVLRQAIDSIRSHVDTVNRIDIHFYDMQEGQGFSILTPYGRMRKMLDELKTISNYKFTGHVYFAWLRFGKNETNTAIRFHHMLGSMHRKLHFFVY